MQSALFCRRNCCVAFARCDGALSCMKTKSLPDCPNKVDYIQSFSVTSWVTSLAWQVSKVLTVLCPIAKAILPRLTTCVFSKAENFGRFYEPPGKIVAVWTLTSHWLTVQRVSHAVQQLNLPVLTVTRSGYYEPCWRSTTSSSASDKRVRCRISAPMRCVAGDRQAWLSDNWLRGLLVIAGLRSGVSLKAWRPWASRIFICFFKKYKQ